MRIKFDIQYADNFSDISNIQDEWDVFVEKNDGDIFLTYDWCRIWWKYYGQNRPLMIYIYRYEGAICGILPVFADTVFIGPVFAKIVKIVGTELLYSAIRLPIKKQYLKDIIESFLYELSQKCRWHIIQIGPLSGRYEFYNTLKDACSHASENYLINEKLNAVQTFFRVENSWDEQLSKLSHNQRKNLKKQYEKIIKDGARLEYNSATKDTFIQYYDNFVNMHQLYWNEKGKPGYFKAVPALYEFYREAGAVQLNKDRLRFYEIKLDGNIIGYTYTFKCGETYYNILYSRAKADSTRKVDFFKIDFGERITRAIKENVEWIDSMRGEFEYKMQLGGILYPVKTLFIYKKGLIKVHVFLFRMLATIIDIFYKKLWRERIAPFMGINVGRFWELWIKTNDLSLFTMTTIKTDQDQQVI